MMQKLWTMLNHPGPIDWTENTQDESVIQLLLGYGAIIVLTVGVMWILN